MLSSSLDSVHRSMTHASSRNFFVLPYTYLFADARPCLFLTMSVNKSFAYGSTRFSSRSPRYNQNVILEILASAAISYLHVQFFFSFSFYFFLTTVIRFYRIKKNDKPGNRGKA